jgi:hypothetical protein
MCAAFVGRGVSSTIVRWVKAEMVTVSVRYHTKMATVFVGSHTKDLIADDIIRGLHPSGMWHCVTG